MLKVFSSTLKLSLWLSVQSFRLLIFIAKLVSRKMKRDNPPPKLGPESPEIVETLQSGLIAGYYVLAEGRVFHHPKSNEFRDRIQGYFSERHKRDKARELAEFKLAPLMPQPVAPELLVLPPKDGELWIIRQGEIARHR
jgi:hypothetical protein